jgi:hypothetical protein
MYTLQFRSFHSLLALAGFASVLLGSSPAQATDNRAPEVPSDIAVAAGNKVHFHGYAEGVQIYTWNGSTWGASVPQATLFDNDGNIVAVHYAGPTWESTSRSKVFGSVVPPRVTVDTNAIPWLLLAADHTEGSGIFAETTFIHRVNTVGGKAPSLPGEFVGQVVEVPYAADYFFYRQENN